MAVELEAGSWLKELCDIRYQLKVQMDALKEKEIAVAQREFLVEAVMGKLEKKAEELRARECLLNEMEDCIATCYTCIEGCLQQEIQHSVECNQELTAKLDANYQRARRDNVRLKDGMTSLCKINEKLKKELEKERLAGDQMKKQLSCLRGRVSSLKIQHGTTQKQEQTPCPQDTLERNRSPIKTPHARDRGDKEMLVQLVHSLMDWVTKALPNCKQEVMSLDQLSGTFSLLSVILHKTTPLQYRLICLQFICQVLIHMSPKTKLLLASSLRRIGEECAVYIQLSSGHYKHCSAECMTHGLSCLVLLQTTSRLEMVNVALQHLKSELKVADVRRAFIVFGGVGTLLPYVSASSKLQVLCDTTLDIFILLSSDSGLKHFLNLEWFNTIGTLLKDNCSSLSQLEKVSLLLQRLSMSRQSKALFVKSNMLSSLNSLATSSQSELTSFIRMNISSALSNINKS